MNENCWMGDHSWGGTSQCLHCGSRLRCVCGAYVRADNLETHVTTCRALHGRVSWGGVVSAVEARLRCPVCGSVDVTQGHLEHCQQVDKARTDAVAHGSSYEVPAITTADLWAHVGGYPTDATRLVRLVLDLGWRPVVGSDPKRLWSAPPLGVSPETNGEQK